MKRQPPNRKWIKRLSPGPLTGGRRSRWQHFWSWLGQQPVTNLIGMCTVFAACGQIWVMQDQLQQMRDDKRPWIAIDDLRMDNALAFPGTMGALAYPTLRLTASGGEPAYFVRPVVFLLPVNVDTGATKCDQVRRPKLSDGEVLPERTYFPSRTYDYVAMGHLPLGDLDTARKAWGKGVLLKLHVCVTYHDRHGSVHQTTRVFRVRGKDPATGKPTPIDTTQQEIGPAHLVIESVDFAEAGRAD